MIMELMPGQIMATLPIPAMSDMLATAHLHLHSLEANAITKTLDMAGIRHDRYSADGRLAWLVERIKAPRCKWLQSGLKWIVENRPEDPDRLVVCHGDFHPINILITDKTISGVLDWSGFIVGDPAYDIGITKVLGTVAAPSLFPKVNWVFLITRYNECYQRGNPIDPKQIGYYEALKCVWALLEGAEGHSAWGHPEVMRKLSEHFKKITSVGLALPKLASS
jgi:aminoglycoside phosphotransferase (APT) family kinase protein